jgi:hypothetical protein
MEPTMSKRNHYLPIQTVTPGMVLADELLDKVGHVLLPAGTALTVSMLEHMAHHDIHFLSILSDVEENEAELAAENELLQKKFERVDYLFRHNRDQPPASLLYAYIKKYRESLLA